MANFVICTLPYTHTQKDPVFTWKGSSLFMIYVVQNVTYKSSSLDRVQGSEAPCPPSPTIPSFPSPSVLSRCREDWRNSFL